MKSVVIVTSGLLCLVAGCCTKRAAIEKPKSDPVATQNDTSFAVLETLESYAEKQESLMEEFRGSPQEGARFRSGYLL